MLCGFHNHDVVEILVEHPYVGRLMNYEKTMLVDMSKSMVKSKNILLKLKEHNEKNVTTIRQVYTARITYRRSQKAPFLLLLLTWKLNMKITLFGHLKGLEAFFIELMDC